MKPENLPMKRHPMIAVLLAMMVLVTTAAGAGETPRRRPADMPRELASLPFLPNGKSADAYFKGKVPDQYVIDHGRNSCRSYPGCPMCQACGPRFERVVVRPPAIAPMPMPTEVVLPPWIWPPGETDGTKSAKATPTGK